MTAKQTEALEYFEQMDRIKGKIPEVAKAIEYMLGSFRHWTGKGHEGVIQGAHHAAFRWFQAWNQGGREGGLPRFQSGLKNALRWTCYKVKPRSAKVIQGLDEAGEVHFDKARGPIHWDVDEARELVRRWNLDAKLDGSLYRFALTTVNSSSKWRPGFEHYRRIKRYELVFEKRPPMDAHFVSEEWAASEGRGAGCGWDVFQDAA